MCFFPFIYRYRETGMLKERYMGGIWPRPDSNLDRCEPIGLICSYFHYIFCILFVYKIKQFYRNVIIYYRTLVFADAVYFTFTCLQSTSTKTLYDDGSKSSVWEDSKIVFGAECKYKVAVFDLYGSSDSDWAGGTIRRVFRDSLSCLWVFLMMREVPALTKSRNREPFMHTSEQTSCEHSLITV